MKYIVLRYKINGCNMKRYYAIEDREIARWRIQALRDNGIEVKVRNFPVRIAVQPLAS